MWLFVPAYVIHLAEEWIAGFPGWVARVVGRPVPELGFLIINGVALVLAVAGIPAAVRAVRHGWIAVALATIVLANSAAHVAGTALTRSSSPGLISAIVLYLPLGTLTMVRAVDHAPRQQITRGISFGLVVHALVLVIAFTATRLDF